MSNNAFSLLFKFIFHFTSISVIQSRDDLLTLIQSRTSDEKKITDISHSSD